ncbi:MAG: hypothetical protein K6G76_09970 [Lachnospiraceae bacterium]|nr:hypothetical protein [Lachnospiraceae bacterium]
MKNDSEVRVCKNKKCKKILPVSYNHKYCEACRNQHAQTVKKGIKIIGLFAAVVLSSEKINHKK